jgi:hypothetical protein
MIFDDGVDAGWVSLWRRNGPIRAELVKCRRNVALARNQFANARGRVTHKRRLFDAVPELQPDDQFGRISDWSYLSDPSKRTGHWTEPLKYIRLDENGAAYLSTGMEVRSRYEGYTNVGWMGRLRSAGPSFN